MSSSELRSSEDQEPSPTESFISLQETEPPKAPQISRLPTEDITDHSSGLFTPSSNATSSAHRRPRSRFLERRDLELMAEEMEKAYGPGIIFESQTSPPSDKTPPDPFEPTFPAPRKLLVDSVEDSLLGIGDVFGSMAHRNRKRPLKLESTTMESSVSLLDDLANSPPWQLPPLETGRDMLQEELDDILARCRRSGGPKQGELAGTESISLRTLPSRKGPRQHASGGDSKAGFSGGQGRAYPPQDEDEDQSCEPGPSGTRRQPPPSGGDELDLPDDKTRRNSPKIKEKADQPDEESQKNLLTDGEKVSVEEKRPESLAAKEEVDKPKAECQTSPRTDEDEITPVPPSATTSSDPKISDIPSNKPFDKTFDEIFDQNPPPRPVTRRGFRGAMRDWRDDLRQHRRVVTRFFHKRQPDDSSGSGGKPPKFRKKGKEDDSKGSGAAA
ncbi:uncharacterized protein KD926_002529 [Aspergillus affinis]|uniref:uncharacterized protein n=1 Tax=Aspergillus affinis TaxID=1070780 RepID=UPI0022FE3B27|nr:uncharacterized protein KD926_002529 [Aspergillus affinis]KAI9036007.1 hypothetical protein KD926_002529 [Aspergillus affinis]